MVGQTRIQAFWDVFRAVFGAASSEAKQALPSSLAGQGVDLVEEDDGRSHGPRLPKHLRVPRATIAAGRKRGRESG